jgi:hypothetical protein
MEGFELSLYQEQILLFLANYQFPSQNLQRACLFKLITLFDTVLKIRH